MIQQTAHIGKSLNRVDGRAKVTGTALYPADIIKPEILFIEEEDPHINLLGAKGLAEICIVGVAAAIANAIYHATGKRIRTLPITQNKLNESGLSRLCHW